MQNKMKQILKILTIALLIGLNSCCDILCERQKHAELIIEKVESFKKENERLPENLKDIGLEYQEHLSFYKKILDDEYEVWYGTHLGVSKIYNSKTKTWREEG